MPKTFTQSLLRRAVMCLPWIVLLVIIGCQRKDDVIAGLSIPIPEKMTKNPDRSFEPIAGFEDGQASYEGKVSPADIFTFYQEVMAAKGWQPTARFAEHKDRIAYTKDNRLVLIRYNEGADGATVLTIMVGTQNPPK